MDHIICALRILNIATLLLTLTIALSSVIWQNLVTSMENMRGDVRDLTKKINELVVNQTSQKEQIASNAEDIIEIKSRLRQLGNNWKRQWKNKTATPPPSKPPSE